MGLLKDIFVIQEMRKKRKEGASLLSIFCTNEYSVIRRWKKDGVPVWKRVLKSFLLN